MTALASEILSAWDGFPKGLKVMVVDRDAAVLTHIRARLEELHYVVTIYSSEEDAIQALCDPACPFHLAIVEAQCEDLERGSKLIKASVKLPTVLMSDTENMELMLRGLACGAVEFLTKPLSDYKLRNIWQHVLRKDSAIGKTIALPEDHTSMVVVPVETLAPVEMKVEQRNNEVDQKGNHVVPAENDSNSISNDTAVLDASTDLIDGMTVAGIIKDIRSEMDEECSDLCDQLLALNNSRSKGDMSLGELEEVLADPYLLDLSLDVDFPADADLLSDLSMESSSILDITFDADLECRDEEALLLAEVAKVENQIAGVDTSNGDNGISSSSSSSSPVYPSMFAMTEGNCNKPPLEHTSMTTEKLNPHSGRKKTKVDWTPELHRRFVQAVEQLGVDNAIPSRILEVMGVQCLTRHNVASHLQKYRSHRRRVQARKTSDARCSNTKKPMSTDSTHTSPNANLNQRIFHVWGHPAIHHMHPYVWPTSPGYWQSPTDGTFWQQTHHGLHHPNQGCIDVWGHPAVIPTPVQPGLYSRQAMRMPLAPLRKTVNTTTTTTTPATVVETQGYEEVYSTLNLFEEAVTAAIKEGMSNPCAPLPLGLKPPSIDSVLSELQKQGASVPSLLIPL